MNSSIAITDDTVVNRIYLIRGKKVMLDRDLADMYGVETKRLNEQVKRNEERFPPDFMFQLSEEELENWKSQIATSNFNKVKMGLRKLPYAFTEEGVAMWSSVLSSKTAIQVNIQIIRIFSRLRGSLITDKNILLKMEQLEHGLLQQANRSDKHDEEIQLVFKALKQLLNPSLEPRDPIGYKMGEQNRQEVD